MKLKNIKKKFITIYILLSILISMQFAVFYNTNTKNESFDNNFKERKLITSVDIGEDPWWNTDFEFRSLLNITNPGSDDFIDNMGVSINFNYSKFVNEGKMNETLKDLRIVENGQLRKYYIQKDFPVLGNATVWFQSNVSASASDYDTYMYYGNDTIGYDYNYLLDNHPMGIAWFKFDSGGGNNIVDSIDGQSFGITSGSAIWAAGKVGSYCFDFSNDYYNLGNLAKYQITGNQTISMWMNTDVLNARRNPFGKAYGGEGTITLEPSGSLSYYYGQGGGNSEPYQGFGSGGSTITIGNWIHVTLVRDLTNRRLYWYKNGEILNSGAAIYSPATVSTLPATIGDNYVSPFEGRIDDLRVYDSALTYDDIQFLYNFNYTIDATPMEEHEQGAQVNVIVRDIDGRAIPNAMVYLHNFSNIIQNQTSDYKGSVSFSIIPYGFYNLTVNYSLSLGSEIKIYDSMENLDIIEFKGLYEEKLLYVNLTTIDFEIDDYDGDPMSLGHVNVTLTPGGTVIETLTLDSAGKATFRWLNNLTYYYSVYYDNIDYSKQNTLINSSTIEWKGIYNETTIFANQSADPLGNYFIIDEVIYANDSSSGSIGKIRLVESDIKIQQMTNYLTFLSIYYVDSEDYYGIENIIFNKEYSGAIQEDDFKLFLTDNYSAYGLRIVLQGYDPSHSNDGTIFVNSTQTTHQYIKTNMSKTTIKVVGENLGNPPVPGVSVHVYNGTTDPINNIVNLTTDNYGYAYGSSYNVSFWYIHDTYNFTLEFFSDIKPFDVNYTNPEQWNPNYVEVYNYSVNNASEIVFELKIDTSDYQTNFSYYIGDSNATWGENLSYEVNFTYTTDGSSWLPLTTPDHIFCEVYLWTAIPLLIYSKNMVNQGDGNFTVTFNSNLLSAGINSEGQSYLVKIIGEKLGYSSPFPLYFPIIIFPLATDYSFHDYSDTSETIIEASQDYNELVNVTASYYIQDNPEMRINNAKLDYYWDYGSGSNIEEDPMNPGYYTFEIDTSVSPTTGKFALYITISLDNYSKVEINNFFLRIRERATSINNSAQITQAPKVWILEAKNFTFEYKDTLTKERISNIETKYSEWFRLDDDGNELTTPGNHGIEYLIETSEHLYIFDFDTETRSLGEYSIWIYLQKNNYQSRIAHYTLTIQERIITIEGFPTKQVSITHGNDIIISLALYDPTNNNQSLTNASVTLLINGYSSIELTEIQAGIYQGSFSTNNIDTLFSSQTLYAIIIIEKDNYETMNYEFSIVVGMVEIFPGVPLFYFLMIVIGVGAVVGSLVGYRFIQLSKIPTFIKKAKSMQKEIKGRKTISEKNLYPSKQEFIAERYEDYWEELGLDLEDILNVDKKKVKKMPDTISKKEDGGVD